MSDKPQTPNPAKKNEKEKKTDNSVIVSQVKPKVKKEEWTLARCQKYARRYTSEVLWASGAPASYKSAVARGWINECLKELNGNTTNKVLPFKGTPQTSTTPGTKKVA